MVHFGVFLTFFGASIANFSTLLVKCTNPFVARTQHIGGGKADNSTFMVKLNAPNALRHFRGMQTFVRTMVARYGAGEAGIYTFFKILVIHFFKNLKLT